MKSDTKGLKLKEQLNRLRNFIVEAGLNLEKRKQYIRSPKHNFTRHRKLDFSTTTVFILGLLKKHERRINR